MSRALGIASFYPTQTTALTTSAATSGNQSDTNALQIPSTIRMPRPVISTSLSNVTVTSRARPPLVCFHTPLTAGDT